MSAALATAPEPTAPIALHATPAAARRRTLQDRAWDLACQGLRAPAIADALGVPQRTVRSWLTATRREVADELCEQHADELLLAVESVRHVAATAWAAYEREVDREVANATVPVRTSRASQAPRYLSLALAAHVQAARLLGLYRKDTQAAYDAALTALATNPAPDDAADDFPETTNSAASADFAASTPRQEPAESAESAEIEAPATSAKAAETATAAALPVDPQPAQAGFVAARPLEQNSER